MILEQALIVMLTALACLPAVMASLNALRLLLIPSPLVQDEIALCQLRRSAAASCVLKCGLKVCALCQIDFSVPSVHSPTALPASMAAPRAVVSVTFGLMTSAPSISA